MKLTIPSTALARHVALAAGVVPRRTTKPILMHMLLEADPTTGLTISATDEELASVGKVEAQVERAGRVAAPARELFDIVRSLPDQPVELDWQADQSLLDIRCGAISFQLHTMAADEHPGAASPIEATVSVDAHELRSLIERTLFAASQDETRFYLGGVHIECCNGVTTAAATDGHRLATAASLIDLPLPHRDGATLPRRLLVELRRSLPTSGEVRIGITDRRCIVSMGDIEIASLLVEGSFPDWRAVIPRTIPALVTAPRIALIEALERVSLLSPERRGKVEISLNQRVENEGARRVRTVSTLHIRASHSGRGRGAESIEVTCEYFPDLVDVSMNAAYLLDALRVVETSDVRLAFHGHLAPIVITGEDERAQLLVVMPMRR